MHILFIMHQLFVDRLESQDVICAATVKCLTAFLLCFCPTYSF